MKKTYFVPYISQNSDNSIHVGNCIIVSNLKGKKLVEYVVEEVTKLVPYAVVLNITRVG